MERIFCVKIFISLIYFYVHTFSYKCVPKSLLLFQYILQTETEARFRDFSYIWQPWTSLAVCILSMYCNKNMKYIQLANQCNRLKSKEYYNDLFQVLDTSIPAHPALATTISVLQKLLFQIEKKARDSPSNLQNVKFIELIIQNCDVLIKRKL